MTIDAGAWQYSAYDLTVKAATRAPTFSSVTPSPTASTTPAASMPGVSGSFGFTTYVPCRKRVSAKFTPIAWILMSTMPGRTSGFGTSDSRNTSGPPVCEKTIAFTLDTSQDVRPLLEHLRMPVADADGEMVVAGPAQLTDALLQLGPGRRERHRAAILQTASAGERGGRAGSGLDAHGEPGRLHVGDGGPGRANVAGGEDPAGGQLGGEPATARAERRDVKRDRIGHVDDAELRAEEADLPPLAFEGPLERVAGQ